MNENINGYSLALLDIAKENKKLLKYKKQAHLILLSLVENDIYIDILDSKSIDLEMRLEILKKVYSKKVEKNLLNYMLLLIEKSKIKYLIPSLKRLISYINEILKIHEGVIYSSNKLTPLEIKKVAETTSTKLGYKVTLENKIDKLLISGIKIVVGDMIVENNISAKLKDLKFKLLEGRVT